MNILGSKCRIKGSVMSVCPECNRPREMQLLYICTSAVKVVKFHRKYYAVCGECGNVFSFPTDKGDKLSHKLNVTVNKSDIRVLKGERNADSI